MWLFRVYVRDNSFIQAHSPWRCRGSQVATKGHLAGLMEVPEAPTNRPVPLAIGVSAPKSHHSSSTVTQKGPASRLSVSPLAAINTWVKSMGV